MAFSLHNSWRLAALAVASLCLLVAAGCDYGAARSMAGEVELGGSVDLVRIRSDAPPAASRRETERYFNGNLGP